MKKTERKKEDYDRNRKPISEDSGKERVHKVIANSGYCSRREAERLIAAGRVCINGVKLTEPGARAGEEDEITVDGRPIRKSRGFLYFLLNKPRGYLTTTSDPDDRPIVTELLPKLGGRVLPVGRLDFNTEGILLFTNDGELLNRLTHPRYGIPRVYLVRARGLIEEEKLLEAQQNGLDINGEPIRDFVISDVRNSGAATWFNIKICEGRNREVRRIVEALGSEVSRLTRIAYGPVCSGIPPKGKGRYLSEAEVAALYESVGLQVPGPDKTGRRR